MLNGFPLSFEAMYRWGIMKSENHIPAVLSIAPHRFKSRN